MKKALIIIICFLFLVAIACQPTPDHEIVINKGDEMFEKKLSEAVRTEQATEETVMIREEKDPSILSSSPNTTLQEESEIINPAQTYSFEKHWSETVSLKSFDIVIDVDIEAPTAVSFPIYKISNQSFTSDDKRIECVLSALCGKIVGKRSGGMTVEDCEDALRAYTRGLYNPDSDQWIPYDKDTYSEGTEEIMSIMRDAPHNADYAAMDSESLIMNSIPCSVAIITENSLPWELSVNENGIMLTRYRRGVIQPERWVIKGYAIPEEKPGTTLNNISFSDEEARSVVKDFFDNIQIGDFAISEMEKARITDQYTYETLTEGWLIQCARVGGNCDAFNYTRYSGNGGWLRYDLSTYSPGLSPESISLFVDSNGIAYFAWTNPIAIKTQVVSRIEMLPFTEIKGLITQAIKNGILWLDDDQPPVGYFNCTVSRVILSYCYVPIKNDPESYYFTPTWYVLFGFDTFINEGQLPFVIAINAVDGTRIDLDSIS